MKSCADSEDQLKDGKFNYIPTMSCMPYSPLFRLASHWTARRALWSRVSRLLCRRKSHSTEK